MNEVRILEHKEFGQVRTTMDKNGNVLFFANDVAKVLGYSDCAKAIKLHCKEYGWAFYPVIDSMGREQTARFINEGNLYRLVTKSKLPSAEEFERWVFEDVLPSIRKYGVYATDELLEHKAMLDTAMEMLAEVRDQKDKMCEIAQELFDVVDEYKPKVDYYDEILRCDCAMTTTQIASDYGLSAVVLNKILEREGVQRRINGQWVLYKKHMGKGYTSSETSPCKKGKRYRVRTKWTQTGRLLIHEILMRLVDEADMELFED